jgi:phosphate transport system substrate-binding protein
MKNPVNLLIMLIMAQAMVQTFSCSSSNDEPSASSSSSANNSSSSLETEHKSEIEGLTFDNYPKVDGSTSTDPLNRMIACQLLGYDYIWINDNIGKTISCPDLALWEILKTSQTHQSLINLIDKDVDLSLVARKMSPDEQKYAEDAGVSLIETPIALDAFIFIVNESNPVQSITVKQAQDIYTRKITNWKEVGGNDAPITPFARNANSGSQELMESLVMKDLDIINASVNELELISTMQGATDMVYREPNSICYSVYYYKEVQRGGVTSVKTLAIEGVYPSSESIGNRTYPLVAEVYASIRSDLNKSSMAYKLYEFLQTEAGNKIISESKYVPYKRSSAGVESSSSSSGGGDKGNDMANYRTVKIGSQTWMAENMNYTVSGSSCGGINNTLKEENTSFCDRYGRLYDWEAANTVCPSGWHLPSSEDWDILMDYVQNDKYLKATSGWNEGMNGEDKYGFAALPGGYSRLGSFEDAGNSGNWWCNSENINLSSSYYKSIYHVNSFYWLGGPTNEYMLSVRCVKD